MNEQQQKFVKEYRAHLTLPNQQITCTVNGNDLSGVKRTVETLIRGQANIATGAKPTRFDDSAGSSLLIYHDSYQGGQEPLGWITDADVPVALSTRTVVEQRMAQTKAA